MFSQDFHLLFWKSSPFTFELKDDEEEQEEESFSSASVSAKAANCRAPKFMHI